MHKYIDIQHNANNYFDNQKNVKVKCNETLR